MRGLLLAGIWVLAPGLAIADVNPASIASPIGSYRWHCDGWFVREGTKSISATSEIDGLVAPCIDIDQRERYDVWVSVPIDRLNQDLSPGYRLVAYSEPGCAGLPSDPSSSHVVVETGAMVQDACFPTPEPEAGIALALLAALSATLWGRDA